MAFEQFQKFTKMDTCGANSIVDPANIAIDLGSSISTQRTPPIITRVNNPIPITRDSDVEEETVRQYII